MERTGDEAFAQALAWGGVATLASDMEPTGMLARKIPVEYQTIADPVMWAVDSLVSNQMENRVVDEAVEQISKNKNKRQQNKPDLKSGS